MNKKDLNFYQRYSKNGLGLKCCPQCGSYIHNMYEDGVYARVYCPYGCGCVTVENPRGEGKMTDEEMAVKAVERWNAGKWDD